MRDYLLEFSQSVEFFVPDVCMQDAQKYLPDILKTGFISDTALTVLSNLSCLLKIVDESFYQEYADEAKQRMKSRDMDDWPVVATALILNSPIWTEDQDFFWIGDSGMDNRPYSSIF